MSARTLTLIVTLCVITGALLFVALTPKQSAPSLPAMAPSPTPAAQSTLSILPNPASVSSPSGSVDVVLDSGTNKATAVQLELSYDPKVLSNVDITPGNFFDNAIVLLKE